MLAVGVLVHLVTIAVAVHGGLSGAEIVGRVGGSVVWLLFYGCFVVTVAVHAAIGLRGVLRETTRLSRVAIDTVALVSGLLLLLTGGEAVLALFGSGR